MLTDPFRNAWLQIRVGEGCALYNLHLIYDSVRQRKSKQGIENESEGNAFHLSLS
jgi:hypothetical protein